MFCSHCGAGSQRADAYCTRCGEWLPDPRLPASRRHASKTPAEKMRVMLVFSALNAALALFSAIALYATYLGREEARWSVYVAAAFCLVIAIHQAISLVLNLQLRSRLARGREPQATTLADAPAARSLNAADMRPFAEARSVTENTTELLAQAPRAGSREQK